MLGSARVSLATRVAYVGALELVGDDESPSQALPTVSFRMDAIGVTRAMAEAWSSDRINANAIGPGFFPTELTASVFADPERSARNAAQICIGRNGTLEDIDGPLLFLCSDASAYVTGQVLMVDGGFTAK